MLHVVSARTALETKLESEKIHIKRFLNLISSLLHSTIQLDRLGVLTVKTASPEDIGSIALLSIYGIKYDIPILKINS
jgi:hypothetical protein